MQPNGRGIRCNYYYRFYIRTFPMCDIIIIRFINQTSIWRTSKNHSDNPGLRLIRHLNHYRNIVITIIMLYSRLTFSLCVHSQVIYKKFSYLYFRARRRLILENVPRRTACNCTRDRLDPTYIIILS